MAEKLGGNNKSRLSYDNPKWSQWVSGFAMIAKEEQNIDTKNAMLDYLSELMEDLNDFSWQSAKASNTVLLCRMEEGKVEWSETSKIDRITHAQRLPSQSVSTAPTRFKSDLKPAGCKFYQKGTCQHQKDHETGGKFYRHICVTCFVQEKSIGTWQKIVG